MSHHALNRRTFVQQAAAGSLVAGRPRHPHRGED